jgi:hypothetical protein
MIAGLSQSPTRCAAQTLWLLVGVFALACAQTASRPDWVQGSAAEFPDSRYVSAVGSGDDLTSASGQAIAGIMQIFVSKVDQTLSDEQTSRTEAGRVVDTSNLSLRTVIESSGAIEGVRIKKNWFDPKTARHYALAVLDKSAAREAFANRLRSADSDLAHAQTLAGEANNALERVYRYQSLVRGAEERDLVAVQHRFVGGGNWPAAPTTSALRAAQARAANEVRFDVEAVLVDETSGTRQPLIGLRDALAQAVSQAGFKVDAGGGDSMRIRCVVVLSAPFERGASGFTHHTWTGSVALEGNTDREAHPEVRADALLVYKADGSASHKTPALALKRTLIDAEETLSLGFQARLEDYLREKTR